MRVLTGGCRGGPRSRVCWCPVPVFDDKRGSFLDKSIHCAGGGGQIKNLITTHRNMYYNLPLLSADERFLNSKNKYVPSSMNKRNQAIEKITILSIKEKEAWDLLRPSEGSVSVGGRRPCFWWASGASDP